MGNNTGEEPQSPPLSHRNTPKCFHKQRTNSGLKGTRSAQKKQQANFEEPKSLPKVIDIEFQKP